MQEYNITIFKQSRILLSLFLTPIFFVIAIFIGAETSSFIIPILCFTLILITMYYFASGNLKIIIKTDNELVFEWKKKFIFNFRSPISIKISDIKTVVLDDDQFLRKIITNVDTIYINNSKIKSKDADKFIDKLKNEVKKYDIRIIDSWDELVEKGYIRLAYIINSFVLLVSIIVVIIFTILKGFNPISFSILLLFIPQMLLYSKQMKSKI
ncbi:hypothetical protein ACNFU2_20595 [Chryseobacterium sp. PTM-20240506]|uniref:hypothetical protein n=1 Tax=unclassified Chryseobacterium TaxID=2593645 RepID=UPI002358D165|nr:MULTISPECIES: hypothetical protein [unclassified Chryseobacterium]MDC8102988.1 hypothetical protein [Chryseobacterium sp. B21-037]MDQ1802536.1 hypothetical protein [Chryseobacterium sp. CKR4-1]